MNIASLQLNSSFLRTFAIGAAISAFVVVSLCVAILSGADWVAMLRDASVDQTPSIFSGLFSNLGIAAMAISFFVCAYALTQPCQNRHLISLLGLFSFGFSLDDALLIHERFGDLEWVIFLWHGLLFLAILGVSAWHYRTIFIWPLLTVGGAFASSIFIDLFWSDIFRFLPEALVGDRLWLGYLLEDAAKLFGILCFALIVVSEALKQNAPKRA